MNANVIGDVFITLFAALIVFLCSLAFNHWKNKVWDVWGTKKVLAFCRSGAKVFVPLGADDPMRGATAAYGDMLALADLLVAARNLDIGAKIEPVVAKSRALSDDEKESNLIVLGGGGSNPHYLQLIERLVPPLHFWDTAENDYKTIRNEAETSVYSPEKDHKGITYDIGLLIYARSPFLDERKVVICAGAYTYGTAAAMQYLVSREGSRKIAKAKSNKLLYVVGCAVAERTIGKIRLLAEISEW